MAAAAKNGNGHFFCRDLHKNIDKICCMVYRYSIEIKTVFKGYFIMGVSDAKNYTFLRFPDFKEMAVTLSYDDGVVYDRKLIEIMSKNGLRGTFNINSGLFAQESGGRRLTKDEALSLYAQSGNEVAVHGYRHLFLTDVDPAVATADVMKDRLELENMFGTIIKGMAYAYGRFNDNVIDILKNCGIEYCRTTVSTEKFAIPNNWLALETTCHHSNPRLMELARSFVGFEKRKNMWSNPPRLFYLWGHSYEFNDNNNWEIIEEFAEFIGNRDDIWYATNGEIYGYVKAYDSLRFSADGTVIHNPSQKDLWLYYFGQEIKIGAGETLCVKW